MCSVPPGPWFAPHQSPQGRRHAPCEVALRVHGTAQNNPKAAGRIGPPPRIHPRVPSRLLGHPLLPFVCPFTPPSPLPFSPRGARTARHPWPVLRDASVCIGTSSAVGRAISF